MSIYIGHKSPSEITTNERIFLKSAVHSNLISLKTDLQKARIWFDNNLTFGRSNQSFSFEKNNIPFLVVDPDNLNIFSTNFNLQDLNVQGNAYVNGSVNADSYIANSFVSYTSPNTAIPSISVYNTLGSNVLAQYDNRTVFQNNVGIFTSTPNYPLHVQGQAFASKIVTNIVSGSLNDRYIDFGGFDTGNAAANPRIYDIFVKGNVYLSNQLFVAGGIVQDVSALSATFLSVTDYIKASSLDLENTTQKNDTLALYHNISGLAGSYCNVISIVGDNGFTTSPYLTMSPFGQLGIGTANPQGLFHVYSNVRVANTRHIALFETQTNPDAIVSIDHSGNVGIGTRNPRNTLHVVREGATSESLVALFNSTSTASILQAFSNQTQVWRVADNGNTTIGAIPYDPSWTLDVVSSTRTPRLQTQYITAPMDNCNIYFDGSRLCNVGHYFGRDMSVNGFVSTSNLITNYFFASNFAIPGLEVFNTEEYFRVTMPSMIYRGDEIVYSPNDTDLNRFSGRTPIENGKMRVHVVENATTNGTSVGINVIGNCSVISQITSSDQPILRFFKQDTNTYGDIYMDRNKNIIIQHSENVYPANPLRINAFKTDFYNNALKITNDGKVGINLADANIDGSAVFEVNGNSIVRSDTERVFHINTRTTATESFTGVGIRLLPSTPLGANFHVNGTSRFDGTTYVNGSVGIGKTNPAFALDVNGTINFSGAIFQGGNPYRSSQWTTQGNSVYLLSSNVGINTASALTPLDVRGTIHATSVGIGATLPLAELHVEGSEILSGNLGVGTTLARYRLHVESGTSYFGGNVGIGTITPGFEMDVNGNINFGGNLYQRGTLYKSSQWTTNENKHIYITGSNVGIGTLSPSYGLHVENGSYFGRDVIFNSNVSINGLLSTRGNIASISDRRVKTNLRLIPHAVDKVAKLNGYTYHRSDTGNRETGLIAQQVQQVLPEAVYDIPSQDLLTISYGNMAGLFVEAIKELSEKISALETKLASFTTA